jgi:hypothetical protein
MADDHFPVYTAALEEITKNPEEVIRQRKTEQIMSLKLVLPEEIRARRRMRQIEYEKFETCMRDIDTVKSVIALAVKTEKEASGKLSYPNKETREVEIQSRLTSDPIYNQRERMRRSMYAQIKSHDAELDYLERMDQTLIECMAMLTAMIEYETATGRGVSDGRSGKRTQSRAGSRAKLAAGSKSEAITVAG